ncbi:MAG: hypothetical protein HFJ98_00400 [Eubacterium sp.]|nr:hypothetical protein [Eubacterium sp.]
MAVRPIDANELQERLKRKTPEPGKRNYVEGFNDCLMRVKSMVHSAKTLNYEPVVYCRDCKHRNKEYSETFCEVLGRLTNDNFYCCYGAKMDEEVKEI